MRSEISADLLLLTIRAASQECIDRRLEEIGTILARAGDGVPQPHPTWVSRPEFWSLSSSNWQAATGAGRAALLSENEQRGLGLYYNVFEFLDREQEREQAAWAQLRGLEDWQGPLTPTARFAFAMALQQPRYSAYRIRAKSVSALDAARVDRIAIPVRSVSHSTSICLPQSRRREPRRCASTMRRLVIRGECGSTGALGNTGVRYARLRDYASSLPRSGRSTYASV
ncbi:MAG: hypothetical protein ABI119_13350 [Gemmatimonadaceae bacterium]